MNLSSKNCIFILTCLVACLYFTSCRSGGCGGVGLDGCLKKIFKGKCISCYHVRQRITVEANNIKIERPERKG